MVQLVVTFLLAAENICLDGLDFYGFSPFFCDIHWTNTTHALYL